MPVHLEYSFYVHKCKIQTVSVSYCFRFGLCVNFKYVLNTVCRNRLYKKRRNYYFAHYEVVAFTSLRQSFGIIVWKSAAIKPWCRRVQQLC